MKLKDICTFIGAGLIKSKDGSTEGTLLKTNAIPLSPGFVNFGNDFDPEQTTESCFVRDSNQMYELNLRHNDILLITKGSSNRVGIVNSPQDTISPFLYPSNTLTLIRVNPKLYSPYFLMSWLATNSGLVALQNIATGSVIRSISLSKLRTFEIPAIPLSEQQPFEQAATALFHSQEAALQTIGAKSNLFFHSLENRLAKENSK